MSVKFTIRSHDNAVKFSLNKPTIRLLKRVRLQKIQGNNFYTKYGYFDKIHTYSKYAVVVFDLPEGIRCSPFWGSGKVNWWNIIPPDDTKSTIYCDSIGGGSATIDAYVYDVYTSFSPVKTGLNVRDLQGEIILSSDTPILRVSDIFSREIPVPSGSGDGPAIKFNCPTTHGVSVIAEAWDMYHHNTYWEDNYYWYEYYDRVAWLKRVGNSCEVQYHTLYDELPRQLAFTGNTLSEVIVVELPKHKPLS